jgi:hypothetical protein
MEPQKSDPALEHDASQAGPDVESNGVSVNRDDADGDSPANADLSYRAVPARRAVAVSVRYQVRGRGRPLPYLDEEGSGQ